MSPLSKDRVFGADPYDERYFELAKIVYKRYKEGVSDDFFSHEFQKNVSSSLSKCYTNLDGTEFDDDCFCTVKRFASIHNYAYDVSAKACDYRFHFIAKNRAHVYVTVRDYSSNVMENDLKTLITSYNKYEPYEGERIYVSITFE